MPARWLSLVQHPWRHISYYLTKREEKFKIKAAAREKIVDVKIVLAGAFSLSKNIPLIYENAPRMAALTNGIAAGTPTGLHLKKQERHPVKFFRKPVNRRLKYLRIKQECPPNAL